MNTLKSQIVRIIESSANTNQTCITLSPEYGWNVSFIPSDREDAAVQVITKEALQEWSNGYKWDDEQFALAAEFITDNLGSWLSEDLDQSERAALLAHIAPAIKATIFENGGGLPNIGELCYDADSDTVYEVVGWDGSLSGNIRTNGPGCGNSIDALLVERGSASDTTEEEWEAIESSNYGVTVDNGDEE
jgi:hypothetical protein